MAGKKETGNTKERLIEAAEKLFAEKGFSEVSLRDITNQASANVAAVSYYFSSKEALADEVIKRHISPVNKQRMEALAELHEQYGDEPYPLREILNAFVQPVIERMSSDEMRGALFGKILGQCMSDRARQLPEAIQPQMKEMLGAFIQALVKSLPELDPVMVLWRLHFSFGVVAHTLMFTDRMSEFSEMDLGASDPETMQARIVDYCLGGLQAEMSSKTNQGGL